MFKFKDEEVLLSDWGLAEVIESVETITPIGNDFCRSWVAIQWYFLTTQNWALAPKSRNPALEARFGRVFWVPKPNFGILGVQKVLLNFQREKILMK